jgi:glycosyltransferase involved in cell wall biosynthesis
MYPLDASGVGPVSRIVHLRDELARRTELDVIDGYRPARRHALGRYAFAGRLRGLDGIYVESSTFLPSESDLLFLALARGLGIEVLTFFRDAYQLFPDWYAADSPRRWLAARLFRPVMRCLAAVSSRSAFPSAGLARVVLGEDRDAVLLPPGSRRPVQVSPAPEANRLLFIGNGRVESQGVPRLRDAIELARSAGCDVELTVVSRPGEEPMPPYPEWLRVEHASGGEIDRLLPETVATIIPRPRGTYNDLAVPLKLYEYLALGRPLIVTDCTETARVVRDAGCGPVVGDEPAAMADGIRSIIDAAPERRASLGAAAHAAARAASWSHRADTILATLGMTGPRSPATHLAS